MYSNYRQKGTRRLCQMSGEVTAGHLHFSLLNPALMNDVGVHTMPSLHMAMDSFEGF